MPGQVMKQARTQDCEGESPTEIVRVEDSKLKAQAPDSLLRFESFEQLLSSLDGAEVFGTRRIWGGGGGRV